MIRFRFDGLPRDLPLSEAQRRGLRDGVGAWKPADGSRPPLWVAFIPGGVSLLVFFCVDAAVWLLHSPWQYAVIVAAIGGQFWLTGRLMRWAMWKYVCRAMAAAGYEVCPGVRLPDAGGPVWDAGVPGVRCGAGLRGLRQRRGKPGSVA